MGKRKVSNKAIEDLYKAFKAKVEEKAGVSLFALKVPMDTLRVQVGDKVQKMHILQVIEAKYGLDLDDLRKLGWTTGKGPKPRTFYLFPPGVGGARKTQNQTEPDIEL